MQRKVYTTRNEKVIDFVIGFLGWFLVNGMLYVLLVLILQQLPSDTQGSSIAVLLGALPLLINIGALILFGFVRRWIAFGALAAFALSLVTILVIGLLVYAVCFSLTNV
jgi:hypothetical protein